LLAYYFPQVYETAVKRAKAKKQDVSQSIKELTGVSPLQLSVEVIDALKLPEFYKAVITSSINMSEGHQPHDEIDSPQTRSLNSAAKALTAAERISSVVVFIKIRRRWMQS
jgi:hypothetical protein